MVTYIHLCTTKSYVNDKYYVCGSVQAIYTHNKILQSLIAIYLSAFSNAT